MTNVQISTEAGDAGPLGFPYEDKIKDLIRAIVDPLINGLRGSVDRLGGTVNGLAGKVSDLEHSVGDRLGTLVDDVRHLVGDTGRLTERLLVGVPGTLRTLADEAEAMVGAVPSFGDAAHTVERLAGSVLDWEAARGAEVRRALAAFIDRAAPVLEALLRGQGFGTRPVDALRGFAAIAGKVDDRLLAPLAGFLAAVDLEDIAAKLDGLPEAVAAHAAHRRGEPAAMAAGDAEQRILIAQAALAILATVIDYAVDAFPLDISVGGEAGVAAGLAASGSAKLKVIKLASATLGALSMAAKVAGSVLGIVLAARA